MVHKNIQSSHLTVTTVARGKQKTIKLMATAMLRLISRFLSLSVLILLNIRITGMITMRLGNQNERIDLQIIQQRAVRMCWVVKSIPIMLAMLAMSMTQFLMELGQTATSDQTKLGNNNTNTVIKMIMNITIFDFLDLRTRRPAA